MSFRLPPASLVAVSLGLLFVLLTVGITWAEHDTFNSTSLDMAVYTQLAWNGTSGRPFETTLLLQNRVHLAEHVALLLLPIAPLYGLVPSVKLLLALQQLALAAAGWPLFWWAKSRVGPGLALVLLTGYYAMPTLAEVALDAFYPIAFATPLVCGAAALGLAGRWRGAALIALLGLLVEEEAALLVLGLGLAATLARPGVRRLAATLLLASIFWLGLLESVVMPRYHQPSSGGEIRAEGHFEQLRANPLGWIGMVSATRLEPDLVQWFARPRVGAQRAACPQAGQCSALRWWLYPTGGIALLAPTTLLIDAPSAAALLLADKPGRFRRHWAAPMLPIIWLAAAGGLVRARRRPRVVAALTVLLLGASLVTYRLDSPLPGGSQYEADDVVLNPSGADLRRFSGEVPEGAAVAASRRGLAHLANRRALYVYPPSDYAPGLWPPSQPPEYVLADLRNEETLRELNARSGPLDPGSGYRELGRTPNALLFVRP